MTQIQSMTVADGWEKLHWPAVLLLHLAPGAAAFGGMLAVEPLIVQLGWPRDFASTVSFAVVLTPVELGLLLVAAHRSTGRWSPAALPAILSYRRRLGRWALLVPALFGVALLIAVGLTPVSNGIGGWMKGSYPAWLLPDFDATACCSTSMVVLTSMLTLLVDGIANPIVEELYFRAWLLPRLPVTGWRAVPLSAGLFALQHYWQPENWLLIFVLQLILTALVIRSRSIRLGIVMHVLANSFGILVVLVSVLT